MSKTKLFAKSKHLHQVSVDDGQIVWHSLTGSPTHLSDGAVDFLNSFDPCRSALTLDNEESNYLSTLGSLGFIIPYGTNERELFQKQVERSRLGFDEGESLVKNLSLVLTDGCNFACRYCIHFASLGCKQLPNKTNVMAEVDAYRALIVYHNELRRNGSSKARINFGGGEPLLAFDLIKAIVERVEAEFGSDFDHEFTLNTNASLVTDAMSSFFAHHNFLIATSLDGLPDVSDTVRVFGDGSPASSAIIEGITRLRDAGNVIDGVAATLTEQNLRLMGRDFIDWSRDQGMTDIRIDIDVVGMVNIPNAEIVAKLTDLRRYGIGE
ncbi:radical SAM protein, partial [Patescibacteria group bacterium]|nr:radical SAM protein [Patescibacteria group bacterium]